MAVAAVLTEYLNESVNWRRFRITNIVDGHNLQFIASKFLSRDVVDVVLDFFKNCKDSGENYRYVSYTAWRRGSWVLICRRKDETTWEILFTTYRWPYPRDPRTRARLMQWRQRLNLIL